MSDDIETVIRIDAPDGRLFDCTACVDESADYALRIGSKNFGHTNTTLVHLCRGCLVELFCAIEDELG